MGQIDGEGSCLLLSAKLPNIFGVSFGSIAVVLLPYGLSNFKSIRRCWLVKQRVGNMEWGRSVVNLVRARELPRRYDGAGKTEAVEIWESRALQREPCLGLTYHKSC